MYASVCVVLCARRCMCMHHHSPQQRTLCTHHYCCITILPPQHSNACLCMLLLALFLLIHSLLLTSVQCCCCVLHNSLPLHAVANTVRLTSFTVAAYFLRNALVIQQFAATYDPRSNASGEFYLVSQVGKVPPPIRKRDYLPLVIFAGTQHTTCFTVYQCIDHACVYQYLSSSVCASSTHCVHMLARIHTTNRL
jgi:hypothetical protein